MTLRDRLLASLDPVQGRRLLDRIEQGVRPTARRRRIAAVMKPPGISYAAWLRQNGYEDIDQRTNGGNR
jgi:hypothetical protein